ncbi:MAG: hypothetical protein JXR68_12970 [Bacteroidales bacterium]|nr:hypothetical protein [Bacteroidales bacterium]
MSQTNYKEKQEIILKAKIDEKYVKQKKMNFYIMSCKQILLNSVLTHKKELQKLYE